jgi:hypothetical protein
MKSGDDPVVVTVVSESPKPVVCGHSVGGHRMRIATRRRLIRLWRISWRPDPVEILVRESDLVPLKELLAAPAS